MEMSRVRHDPGIAGAVVARTPADARWRQAGIAGWTDSAMPGA